MGRQELLAMGTTSTNENALAASRINHPEKNRKLKGQAKSCPKHPKAMNHTLEECFVYKREQKDMKEKRETEKAKEARAKVKAKAKKASINSDDSSDESTDKTTT
ncbi:hypothetical protein FRB93_005882 [Tulasnella sp. JGI-2019a]|nr:hypothetical protein FRB93_005882 [Tulasnella sp. JGI-2019a]